MTPRYIQLTIPKLRLKPEARSNPLDYKGFNDTWQAPRGGGYSNFFGIRRLGPSIYRSPQKKKYQEFQEPQKNIRNLSNPKKYPNSVP